MSGTYLICDLCGQYGPPAGFIAEQGIRLCQTCWHQSQQEQPQDQPLEGQNQSHSAADTRVVKYNQ